MASKLLTIAIPTYNRAKHLALLLDVLERELHGMWSHVELMVFDNASTDETPDVTAAFLARCPECRVVRHTVNIGSAPNFLACIEAATSQYFWLIGDDDAPVKGLLPQLLGLLSREAPYMVYLESLWADDIAPLVPEREASASPARVMDRKAFARRTNVYLTFISSIVVDRTRLRRHVDVPAEAAQLGAHFVQLSWTLGALRSGDRFAVIDEPCILATGGNSGGYGALTTFGSEFPKVVRRMLGNSVETHVILRRTLACYLPALTWNLRKGTAGAFVAEDPWPLLRRELGASPLFWVILMPLGRLPRLMATPFYQCWRVVNRAFREFDRRAANRTSALPASGMR